MASSNEISAGDAMVLSILAHSPEADPARRRAYIPLCSPELQGVAAAIIDPSDPTVTKEDRRDALLIQAGIQKAAKESM